VRLKIANKMIKKLSKYLNTQIRRFTTPDFISTLITHYVICKKSYPRTGPLSGELLLISKRIKHWIKTIVNSFRSSERAISKFYSINSIDLNVNIFRTIFDIYSYFINFDNLKI